MGESTLLVPGEIGAHRIFEKREKEKSESKEVLAREDISALRRGKKTHHRSVAAAWKSPSGAKSRPEHEWNPTRLCHSTMPPWKRADNTTHLYILLKVISSELIIFCHFYSAIFWSNRVRRRSKRKFSRPRSELIRLSILLVYKTLLRDDRIALEWANSFFTCVCVTVRASAFERPSSPWYGCYFETRSPWQHWARVINIFHSRSIA